MSIVINISHTSTSIPKEYKTQFTIPDWCKIYENLYHVDWFIEEIFDAGFTQLTAPCDGILVDTTKHPPDFFHGEEPADDPRLPWLDVAGNRIRKPLSLSEKKQLLKRFYFPHHRNIKAAVNEALAGKYNRCLLIDARSCLVGDAPFYTHFKDSLPHIKLGIHPDNTPDDLVAYVKKRLGGQFVVEEEPWGDNKLVPRQYLGDKRVKALRIMINQAVYSSRLAPIFSNDLFVEECLPVRKKRLQRLHNLIEDILHECFMLFVQEQPESTLSWIDYLHYSRRKVEMAKYHKQRLPLHLQAWINDNI